jgi:outer membrane lipoprotein-sorting protein
MKKYLFLLSILLTSFLSAQDAKEWINKMNTAYKSATSLSMNFQADYFASGIQLSATTSVKGEVRYSGMNYYSDAMGQIVVSNKRSMLIVNKTEHTITCLPGSEESPVNDGADNVAGGPDSSWARAAQLKLLGNDGLTQTIEIIEKDGVYAKTVLKVNVKTYALEEVVFYYNSLENGSKPKLVVRYSNVKFNVVIAEADFSEKKYIQKKNGKIIPAPAWSSYTIIDLTNGPEPK